jgi:hypothetical protein
MWLLKIEPSYLKGPEHRYIHLKFFLGKVDLTQSSRANGAS